MNVQGNEPLLSIPLEAGGCWLGMLSALDEVVGLKLKQALLVSIAELDM